MDDFVFMQIFDTEQNLIHKVSRLGLGHGFPAFVQLHHRPKWKFRHVLTITRARIFRLMGIAVQRTILLPKSGQFYCMSFSV